MNRTRALIWGIPSLLYAAFCAWYTDWSGPLRESEISAYLAKLETQGFPGEMRDRIREFMETDTGRQFLMVNVLDFAEDPPDVAGAEPGESAPQLMDRYMEHMYRELIKRACHPTVYGKAVHTAVDLVGVEALDAPERWDQAAFVRYRSRRTFMEVITIPETRGRHAFKVAALAKTIAYPVETIVYLGDPRLLLGLLLLGGAALLDLGLGRKS